MNREEFTTEVLERLRSAGPIERFQVAELVKLAYEAQNLSPPPVIYCQSPWQRVVAPLILDILL